MPPVLLRLTAALLGLLLLLTGARGIGPLPPLGPLLDPGRGAWATARGAELPASAAASIPGLAGPVAVSVDDRGVPHIRADRALDAVRALGYVVARDRLLQMELQARSADGTLTELAGARALPLDRRTQAMGMPWGIRRRWAALQGTATAEELQAFADGVNGWIADLTPATVPVEYRLLGAWPRRWAPEHSIALLMEMSRTLAWSEEEEQFARAAAVVGDTAAAALYPVHSPIVVPMHPTAAGPRLDGSPLPPPAAGSGTVPLARQSPDGKSSGDGVGSNAWVVMPSRSAAGQALLAGDPHLALTLPSIWYEVRLSVGDSLDVRGVTIPGAPSVIIGHSRAVAWSFTNATTDVRDLWQETVDAAAAPTRYRLDGAWQPLELEVVTYRNARGAAVGTDTLRRTHRGPLRREADGSWTSLRWTALEPSDELLALRGLMRARGIGEAEAALRHFRVPAQNAALADTAGRVAIITTGRHPQRADNQPGNRRFDGATRATDWLADRPWAEQPKAIDPVVGFALNANQEQWDPVLQPGQPYFGGDWPAPWRALRLDARLRADGAWTADAVRALQTDAVGTRAEQFLPALLAATGRAGCEGAASDSLARAAQALACWDRRYAGDTPGPLLFDRTMQRLQRLAWDELRPDGDPASGLAPLADWPSEAVLRRLLETPEALWWDRLATPGRETRDDVLRQALAEAWHELAAAHGTAMGEAWWWSTRRSLDIPHLLRLPGFARTLRAVSGGTGTISPLVGNGNHGASWRMVVALDPAGPTAFGIYPGGQRGHPLSRFYDDRLAAWRAGQLAPLSGQTATIATLRLTGAAR